MKPRKNWERQETPVKYCSKQCRRQRIRTVDLELENTTVGLLAQRSPSSSICPSEVARKVEPETWKKLMEPSRMAARRLVAKGLVEMTQGGRVVDPSTAKGPVRIRRSAGFDPRYVAKKCDNN